MAISLGDLVPYIDWSPFFHAWEMRGRYPAIFDDPKIGKQARELFDDAQELLEGIVAKNLLASRGVYAFWPANAVDDDVEVYADEARTERLATFYFLRQQMQKPTGQFNHCLADYIAPRSRIENRESRIGMLNGGLLFTSRSRSVFWQKAQLPGHRF
jgi:5-methyltetrahydrofolate--homocysteine methyltransferase